jgi:hypothetical protein
METKTERDQLLTSISCKGKTILALYKLKEEQLLNMLNTEHKDIL